MAEYEMQSHWFDVGHRLDKLSHAHRGENTMMTFKKR
jgi:hypothetical protein